MPGTDDMAPHNAGPALVATVMAETLTSARLESSTPAAGIVCCGVRIASLELVKLMLLFLTNLAAQVGARRGEARLQLSWWPVLRTLMSIALGCHSKAYVPLVSSRLLLLHALRVSRHWPADGKTINMLWDFFRANQIRRMHETLAERKAAPDPRGDSRRRPVSRACDCDVVVDPIAFMRGEDSLAATAMASSSGSTSKSVTSFRLFLELVRRQMLMLRLKDVTAIVTRIGLNFPASAQSINVAVPPSEGGLGRTHESLNSLCALMLTFTQALVQRAHVEAERAERVGLARKLVSMWLRLFDFPQSDIDARTSIVTASLAMMELLQLGAYDVAPLAARIADDMPAVVSLAVAVLDASRTEASFSAGRPPTAGPGFTGGRAAGPSSTRTVSAEKGATGSAPHPANSQYIGPLPTVRRLRSFLDILGESLGRVLVNDHVRQRGYACSEDALFGRAAPQVAETGIPALVRLVHRALSIEGVLKAVTEVARMACQRSALVDAPPPTVAIPAAPPMPSAALVRGVPRVECSEDSEGDAIMAGLDVDVLAAVAAVSSNTPAPPVSEPRSVGLPLSPWDGAGMKVALETRMLPAVRWLMTERGNANHELRPTPNVCGLATECTALILARMSPHAPDESFVYGPASTHYRSARHKRQATARLFATLGHLSVRTLATSPVWLANLWFFVAADSAIGNPDFVGISRTYTRRNVRTPV